MAQRLRQVDGEEELLEAFKVFDIDGDGFITAGELKQVIQENCRAFNSRFSPNQGAKIYYWSLTSG